MKRLLAVTVALFIALGVAMAYSGDVAIGSIATAGNSSNYTITAQDTTVAGDGSSGNYTITMDVYTYDAEENIYVAPPPDNDGGSSSTRSSSSNVNFFPSMTPTETAEEDVEVISFSSLISTENNSLVITSPRETDMFERLNVSLNSVMRNVRFRVVETRGATQRSELSLFKGEVYKLLDVEHDVIPEEDIVEIILSFKVEKEWADNRNANPRNVTLFRYDGFAWNALPTNHTRTDGNYYYFTAVSPGLSTYVVGIEEQEDVIVETTPTNTSASTITGNVIGDNASETDDVWDDYEEPKNLSWLWLVLLGVIIGGMIAGFFVIKKKHDSAPAQQPKRSPAAASAPQEDKKPVKEETTASPVTKELTPAEETKREELEFAKEPPQIDSTTEQVVEQKPLFTDEDEQVLTNFIQTLFDKGFTVEQFKPKLVMKGWSEKQVDYCLKQLGKK